MNDPRTGFLVEIQMHNNGARLTLYHPEKLKHIIGAALEAKGLQEGVDFTLTVDRAMPVIRGNS